MENIVSIMHGRIVKSIEELTKESSQIKAALPGKRSALQNLLVLKELQEPFDHEQLIILQREVEQGERRLAQIALAIEGLENKKAEEEKAHEQYKLEQLQLNLKKDDLEILRGLRDKAIRLRDAVQIDERLRPQFCKRNENVIKLKQLGQEAPVFCAGEDWYAEKGRASSGICPWDAAAGEEGLKYLDEWIAKLEKEI